MPAESGYACPANRYAFLGARGLRVQPVRHPGQTAVGNKLPDRHPPNRAMVRRGRRNLPLSLWTRSGFLRLQADLLGRLASSRRRMARCPLRSTNNAIRGRGIFARGIADAGDRPRRRNRTGFAACARGRNGRRRCWDATWTVSSRSVVQRHLAGRKHEQKGPASHCDIRPDDSCHESAGGSDLDRAPSRADSQNTSAYCAKRQDRRRSPVTETLDHVSEKGSGEVRATTSTAVRIRVHLVARATMHKLASGESVEVTAGQRQFV
jgi:hypothetical protein